MKNVLLATATALLFANAAYAESTTNAAPAVPTGPVLGGSIEVEVKENAAGDYAATTTFGVGITAPGLAFGEASVESVDGSTFEINKWYIGTVIGSNATLSFGDHDGGIFVESYSDYSNILAPAMNESLIVSMGDAAVAVGFTDITSDITDVSNVQGAYSVNLGAANVLASADYNLDSEDYAVGLRTSGIQLAGIGLGSTVSYGSATETFAYELDGSVMGVVAYVNGDQDDALQNVGAGYEREIGGLTLSTDINYNIDTEEFSPTAGISFSF